MIQRDGQYAPGRLLWYASVSWHLANCLANYVLHNKDALGKDVIQNHMCKSIPSESRPAQSPQRVDKNANHADRKIKCTVKILY